MEEKDFFNNTALFGNQTILTNEDSVETKSDDFSGSSIGLAVDIKELTLITNGGQELSLLPVYDGLAIKEDLYTTFIHGIVKIFDNVGGLEKFALRGGETLILKICKPKTNDVIIWRRDLVITKIGESVFDIINNRTTYELSFSPIAHINSIKTNVYKSFKGLPIADIVTNLYKDISVNTLIMEDPKVSIKTDNPFQSSGRMPHEVIYELAKRACSKNKYFVFFERFIPVYGSQQNIQEQERLGFSGSHYFGSIEKLIEDSESIGVKTLIFTPSKSGVLEPNYIRVFSMKRSETFKHLLATRKGFYATEFCSIDLIKRKCKNKNVGYLENDKKTFYNNKLVDNKSIFSVFNKSRGQVPGKKVFVSSINDSVNREDWLPHEFVRRISTTYFRILVEISGGTNGIDVGSTVKFLMPSSSQRNIEVTNPNVRFDPIHSGRYLVTGVNHVLRNGQYLKTLELSRESTPFDYVEAEKINLIDDNV